MARRDFEHTLGKENTGYSERGQSQKEHTVAEHEQGDKQRQNGTQPDEETNSPEMPPLPVGLFDPSLKGVQKMVVRQWSITVLVLFCFILCILSLYWAMLFKVEENMSALTVAVVGFDGRVAPYEGTTPLVGQVVERLTRQKTMISTGVLGYRIESPKMYGGDPFEVRQAVYEEKAWAAIIVNANATALLQQAVATGDTNYSPNGAAQVIINQARDDTSYSNYIIPQLSEFQVNVASMFGEQWIQNVLSNTSLDAATYSQAPQALNPAIGFSMFNLRHFTPPQVTPAVTIGLIYLIIIAFFSFSFFLQV